MTTIIVPCGDHPCQANNLKLNEANELREEKLHDGLYPKEITRAEFLLRLETAFFIAALEAFRRAS